VTARRHDDRPAPVRAATPDRLPVRTVRFEYPADLDPAWNHRYPELAFAANSVSLLMPYAEPYFVRSVRSALPDLEPELRARTEDFLKQELRHHVQHRRFNDILDRQSPRLVGLERWIARTYGWFGRTRSQRYNLAFAAGSETIAFTLARWTEAHLDDFFDDTDPVAATLFLWHLAEEVEHKTVAFDVWEAIDGSRRRYAMAMFTSFAILASYVTLASLIMAFSCGRGWRPVTYFRMLRWSLSMAFEVLPDMAASAMPGHHPSDFTDPVWLTTWLTHFDPATGTIPLARRDLT
jgi:predicted metal-dependent hydrolase